VSETLALAKLRLDGGTQSRSQISDAIVSEYAAVYDADRRALPPVVVFFDGAAYWLADGFHRAAAAARAGLPRIAVDIRQGSQRDAILYSVGANAAHGLRRTNADKRRAVTVLLSDTEWRARSDRWIAEQCGVGHPFVAHVRGQLESDSSCDVATGECAEPAASEKRTGKDGKQRKQPAERGGEAEPCEPAPPPEPARRWAADAEALHAVNRIADIVNDWPDEASLYVLVESLSQYVRRLEQRVTRRAS
jgi:hypothetical protein